MYLNGERGTIFLCQLNYIPSCFSRMPSLRFVAKNVHAGFLNLNFLNQRTTTMHRLPNCGPWCQIPAPVLGNFLEILISSAGFILCGVFFGDPKMCPR